MLFCSEILFTSDWWSPAFPGFDPWPIAILKPYRIPASARFDTPPLLLVTNTNSPDLGAGIAFTSVSRSRRRTSCPGPLSVSPKRRRVEPGPRCRAQATASWRVERRNTCFSTSQGRPHYWECMWSSVPSSQGNGLPKGASSGSFKST